MDATLGIGLVFLAGLIFFVGWTMGRRAERQRCVTICSMFYSENGRYIAEAIESEMLP